MKRWLVVLFILVAAVALGAWKAEPFYLGWLAGKLDKQSLGAHEALIAPDAKVFLPEGDGPFPAVLMFHGCAGARAKAQAHRAQIINEAGFAAIDIDSMTPRGLTRQDALDQVCTGKKLIGQERAADVFAAIDLAKKNPKIDASKIVLAGWSHGGWTVMDFLTMDPTKAPPPPGFSETLEKTPIAGAILYFPYCGLGARSRFASWKYSAPVIAFLAADDEIVDTQECEAVLEKKKRSGADVEFTVYPDTNHAFDDPYLEPEWLYLYNEKSADDSARKMTQFLENIAN